MDGLAIGRIVHYVDEFARHNAAIITHVIDAEDGLLQLFVADVNGHTYTTAAVQHDPARSLELIKPGTGRRKPDLGVLGVWAVQRT